MSSTFSFVTYRCQYAMMRVVSGSARITPMKPKSDPQTDNESRMMAGLRPIALPITRGVTTISEMICTTANTKKAIPKMAQKFWPVSAAFSKAKNAVGMR